MRLYIIGNVCSISASATAIQPTNIPTHNPNIAIKIFPQILLTGTLGIFAKPRLYAVSSTDDILPATTPIQVEMDKHNKDTWNTIIDKVKEKQDV